MHENRCEFNWWEANREMTVINWESLYYTFGTSRRNYEVAKNFKVSLDEKRKSNLKLLRDKTL